jgi:hypothetical protein
MYIMRFSPTVKHLSTAYLIIPNYASLQRLREDPSRVSRDWRVWKNTSESLGRLALVYVEQPILALSAQERTKCRWIVGTFACTNCKSIYGNVHYYLDFVQKLLEFIYRHG